MESENGENESGFPIFMFLLAAQTGDTGLNKAYPGVSDRWTRRQRETLFREMPGREGIFSHVLTA